MLAGNFSFLFPSQGSVM